MMMYNDPYSQYHDYNCDLLPPKTPKLSRKSIQPPGFRGSVSRQSSVTSSFSDLLSSVCNLSELLDPQICDKCTWCHPGDDHDDKAVEDTRFMVSMVTHQLPRPDYEDNNEDLLLASLVAHMVCKFIGDEERLREEYINYVENYIHYDEDSSFSNVSHHNFLTSFLTHCLPHLDPDTDPALCHLISSLVSHAPVFDVPDLDQEEMSQISRYSTDTSDLFPHNLLSVSSLDEENCADTTPESLHSLERIPLVFPNRHLLSNFSPERLDRNFSESPEQSHRFSSTPSDGDKEWWEGEDEGDYEEEEEGIDIPEENVFNKHDFETRELSIVFEETEFEDSESDSDNTVEDKVVTGVCTIGIETGIQIETVVNTVKKSKVKKKVTFSKDSPTIIEIDIPEEVETDEPAKEIIVNGKQKEESSQDETETDKSATTTTVNCKKCKQKKQLNVRMSLILGSDKNKEKKSIIDVVVGWFGRFL